MGFHWNPSNLREHHLKHPAGACRTCWAELLKCLPTVDQSAYEEASLQVIASPSMTFSALYQRKPYADPIRTQYFIDERLLVTAGVGASKEISTCYRWHSRQIDHSTQCDLTAWLNMIRRFAEKQCSVEGRMTDYRNVLPRVRHLTAAEQEAIKQSSRKLTAARPK
jgi:hypothetical protein